MFWKLLQGRPRAATASGRRGSFATFQMRDLPFQLRNSAFLASGAPGSYVFSCMSKACLGACLDSYIDMEDSIWKILRCSTTRKKVAILHLGIWFGNLLFGFGV
jgi:hypothetical protein